jgi:hypothetical protein
MPKGLTFTNDFLKLFFNGGAIANIADNAASSPITSLWLALHTADPGSAGNQSTNEISYTSYARVGVARTSAAFTVSARTVSLAALQAFPASTGGAAASATFFSVGTASSGTGKLLYSGTLTPGISISNGVTPQINSGTIITED